MANLQANEVRNEMVLRLSCQNVLISATSPSDDLKDNFGTGETTFFAGLWLPFVIVSPVRLFPLDLDGSGECSAALPEKATIEDFETSSREE